MPSICVLNMIKQSKSLQTRHDVTYINDRYYTRTHVYVFLFMGKNACLNYRELGVEGDLVGCPIHGILGLVFHNTIKTYLKRVGHGGYE